MKKSCAFIGQLGPVLYLLFSLAFVSHSPRAAAETLPDCSKSAGGRPNPSLPIGFASNEIPLEHIIVIMQENHSFDNYLGKLNQPQFYGSEIDGLSDQMSNPDSQGIPNSVFHEASLCPADPNHTWNGEHQSWNHGLLDGFVRTNGSSVMGYYDETDLPLYYSLANQFAVADRYFCSSLTQTFPNRFYLMTGTSFGHIKNDLPFEIFDFHQRTIFEQLSAAHVSWAYYTDAPLGGYAHLFRPMWITHLSHMKNLSDFRADLMKGRLPHVVFVDSSFEGEDEHPESNIQIGQSWVGSRIQELMNSSAWKSSVLLLTYDENGGFYDHVAPPLACLPDNQEPLLRKTDTPGHFDRYGFRVPFIAIGPFVKHHFVSHTVYDHTSILKLIETKYNLPALTARDGNANNLLDLFDFEHPDYTLPRLPRFEPDASRECKPKDLD